MSDAGRQDISDKIHNKLKPDSRKTTGEYFSDKVQGTVDNIVGHGTSKHDKSKTQEISDKIFQSKK